MCVFFECAFFFRPLMCSLAGSDIFPRAFGHSFIFDTEPAQKKRVAFLYIDVSQNEPGRKGEITSGNHPNNLVKPMINPTIWIHWHNFDQPAMVLFFPCLNYYNMWSVDMSLMTHDNIPSMVRFGMM